uniref:Adenosylmethionine decarboxylase n=1 Tax=viral metagenome TaxID=1070528 RepID=A0A6C0KLF7_9ZZZZ
MFSESQYSGKHLLCDIKQIRNRKLLSNIDEIKRLMDSVCNAHQYTILQKIEHTFDPQGFSVIYLLSESHMSIHTFPERDYLAFDLYTCRTYANNDEYNQIYNTMVTEFDADRETPNIINRYF